MLSSGMDTITAYGDLQQSCGLPGEDGIKAVAVLNSASSAPNMLMVCRTRPEQDEENKKPEVKAWVQALKDSGETKNGFSYVNLKIPEGHEVVEVQFLEESAPQQFEVLLLCKPKKGTASD